MQSKCNLNFDPRVITFVAMLMMKGCSGDPFGYMECISTKPAPNPRDDIILKGREILLPLIRTFITPGRGKIETPTVTSCSSKCICYELSPDYLTCDVGAKAIKEVYVNECCQDAQEAHLMSANGFRGCGD